MSTTLFDKVWDSHVIRKIETVEANLKKRNKTPILLFTYIRYPKC